MPSTPLLTVKRGMDDSSDEWVQKRLSRLKQDAHIQYFDDDLDAVHDGDGYYDDTGDHVVDLYHETPTRIQRVKNWLIWQWRLFVLLMALLIPAALLIGVILAVSRLDRDAADVSVAPDPSVTAAPVMGAWPAIDYAPHMVPAMIRHEIAMAGVLHGYQFEGAAGDVWLVTVEPSAGSGFDPLVQIYAPSGEELVMNDNRATGDVSAEVIVMLPTDGWYRVVVRSAGEGLSVGEYWLMVYEQ